MVVQNDILRIFATRLLYLIVLAIFLSMVANVFVFFSHAELIATEKHETARYSTTYHVPKVEWDQPNAKEAKGVFLESFDQDQIIDAYQNAWYFLNEALRKRSPLGLEDFFSDNLIKEINLLIDSDNAYNEDRVDLKHNIDMYLF